MEDKLDTLNFNMYSLILLAFCIFSVVLGYSLRPVRTLAVRRNGLRVYEGVEGAGDLEDQEVTPDINAELKRQFKAIRQYKEIYGNLAVDSTFIVPSADFSWPEDTWGLELGSVVDKIKNTDDYDGYKAELEDIGFKYSAPSAPMSGLEPRGSGFEPGQLVTYGLYAWILYLAVDTARIVFFTGPPGQ